MEKMGFPEMYAVAALRQTDNDINASMDIIQEHPGEKNHVLFCPQKLIGLGNFTLAYVVKSLQGSAKKWSLGCVNSPPG